MAYDRLWIIEHARERPGGPKLYEVMRPGNRLVAQLPRRGQAVKFIEMYYRLGPAKARRYEQGIWRRSSEIAEKWYRRGFGR